jgi:hypothetical protein
MALSRVQFLKDQKRPAAADLDKLIVIALLICHMACGYSTLAQRRFSG